MSQVSGVDIGKIFNTGVAGLEKDGKALQDKINSISSNGDINQADLLKLQYAMGQYNAKLETISSVTKSMQDMLKSLAQRTG
ncbi:MAG: type III secretion protein [Desulfovibrionaceae bacterium]|nr:type III secretion protein [Desulfovibrionaceae bacterium]